MRIDWYTKGVLTVIAVLLAMVVFKQYLSPDTVVRADGSFSGVQFASYSNGSHAFFDARTGDVWDYPGTLIYHYRLSKLGAPLVKEK